jgi:hypothetical protein
MGGDGELRCAWAGRGETPAPPSPTLPRKLRGGGRELRPRFGEGRVRGTPPPRANCARRRENRGALRHAAGCHSEEGAALILLLARTPARRPRNLPSEPPSSSQRPDVSAHHQPLSRSWERGRPPLRGTSKKAVGGEGLPVPDGRGRPLPAVPVRRSHREVLRRFASPWRIRCLPEDAKSLDCMRFPPDPPSSFSSAGS